MKLCASFLLPLAVLALVTVPQSALACAACMGDPNSDIAGAANAAVLTMLILIGGVLSLISAVGYSLYRRSLAPAPPHAEIAGDIGAHSEGGIS